MPDNLVVEAALEPVVTYLPRIADAQDRGRG
jgi:hypothetical protein